MTRSTDLVDRFHVTAQASLTQEMKRTWMASLSYIRGTQFVFGFSNMAYTDVVRAQLQGQVKLRTQFVASADYAKGEIDRAIGAPQYGSYTGSGRLSVALSRTLGLYAQYLYYYYDVPPDSIAASIGVAPRLGRQTFTVGVNGLVPFIGGRARRDSR